MRKISSCLNPCSNGIPSDPYVLVSNDDDSSVLILVLMEYPLTCDDARRFSYGIVLILVLMEYPLTTLINCAMTSQTSLNPCSNGIPSDKSLNHQTIKVMKVLILVLMEYPLTMEKRIKSAVVKMS